MTSTKGLNHQSVETDTSIFTSLLLPCPLIKRWETERLTSSSGLIQAQALFYVERIKSWPPVSSHRPALCSPGSQKRALLLSPRGSEQGVPVAVVCFRGKRGSHADIQKAAPAQTHFDPFKCPKCPSSHSHFFLRQVLWLLAWDTPVISLSVHLIMFKGWFVKDREFFYRLRGQGL